MAKTGWPNMTAEWNICIVHSARFSKAAPLKTTQFFLLKAHIIMEFWQKSYISMFIFGGDMEDYTTCTMRWNLKFIYHLISFCSRWSTWGSIRPWMSRYLRRYQAKSWHLPQEKRSWWFGSYIKFCQLWELFFHHQNIGFGIGKSGSMPRCPQICQWS